MDQVENQVIEITYKQWTEMYNSVVAVSVILFILISAFAISIVLFSIYFNKKLDDISINNFELEQLNCSQVWSLLQENRVLKDRLFDNYNKCKKNERKN